MCLQTKGKEKVTENWTNLVPKVVFNFNKIMKNIKIDWEGNSPRLYSRRTLAKNKSCETKVQKKETNKTQPLACAAKQY